MTPATSNPIDGGQIDVSVGTIKRMLIDAYEKSTEGQRSGAGYVAAYWDGYIRALQHVLEAQEE